MTIEVSSLYPHARLYVCVRARWNIGERECACVWVCTKERMTAMYGMLGRNGSGVLITTVPIWQPIHKKWISTHTHTALPMWSDQLLGGDFHRYTRFCAVFLFILSSENIISILWASIEIEFSNNSNIVSVLCILNIVFPTTAYFGNSMSKTHIVICIYTDRERERENTPYSIQQSILDAYSKNLQPTLFHSTDFRNNAMHRQMCDTKWKFSGRLHTISYASFIILSAQFLCVTIEIWCCCCW